MSMVRYLLMTAVCAIAVAAPAAAQYRGPYPDRRGPRTIDPRQAPRDGYFYDEASDRGFSDGYEKGLEDARDGDRYDPVRHKWYRSADRGYNGRYGVRERYKNLYRDGFRSGYDRGYRDGRRYERRDNRRPDRPWWRY